MKFKFSILFFALFGFAQAQENVTFQKPSQEILQLADFQRPPAIMMSQDKQWVVSTYRPTYKSLDELNQSEVKLAGLRINPVTNISSTTVYLDNIKVKRFGEKVDRQITGLPINPKIANVSFSPDGKKLAFTNTTTNGVELWLVDLAAAAATKITKDDLNANMELPYTWFKDGQKLLLSKLPANRNKLIDSSKDLPKGPIVSTSDGQVSQLRTYQDLLKNPQDEANFETLTQAEVFITDLNGNQSKFLGSAIYSQLSFSPDGNYLLTSIIKRPFSYVVPLNSFPQESVVYDLKGSRIKVVNEVPLIEIMPKGFSSVRKGKRSLHWRTDKPASLAFVQALDEGDATKKSGST